MGKVELDEHVLTQRASEQLHQLLDDVRHVQKGGANDLLPRKAEKLGAQFRGTTRGGANLGEVVSARVAGVERVADQDRVVVDDREQVVEVVSDAAGEPADRLELLTLPKLGLQIP